jgi:hypothetical protein
MAYNSPLNPCLRYPSKKLIPILSIFSVTPTAAMDRGWNNISISSYKLLFIIDHSSFGHLLILSPLPAFIVSIAGRTVKGGGGKLAARSPRP